MKIIVRVAVGIVGLVAIVLGVRQFMQGVHEISGKPATQAQKLGETYTSTEHGYSHRIPAGWHNKAAPRPEMIMIVAPQESGMSSNMVTTVESYPGSLRDYTDANIKSLQTTVPDAKVLSDTEFTTDAKVPAYKLKLHNKMGNTELAQTMYLFEGPSGEKIIVTCTSTTGQAGQLEPLFDDCMKTFALSGR